MTSAPAIAVILHTIPGSQGYEIWLVYSHNRREMLVVLSPSVSLEAARAIASLVAVQNQLKIFEED